MCMTPPHAYIQVAKLHLKKKKTIMSTIIRIWIKKLSYELFDIALYLTTTDPQFGIGN